MLGTLVRLSSPTLTEPSLASSTPTSSSPIALLCGVRPMAHNNRSVSICLPSLHSISRLPSSLLAIGLERQVEPDVDALVAADLNQAVDNLVIIATQYPVAAGDQRHIDTKFVEDARKFIGDITAARDHRAFGERRQAENFVRGNAVTRTRYLRHRRPCAGCDKDMRCGNFAPADELHAVRPGNDRPLAENLDIVIAQRLAVQPFEPVDLGCDIIAQGAPVESRFFGAPAKAFGIFHILGKMRAINEQLFRNTAADDAGAADTVLLGNRHLARRAMPKFVQRGRRPNLRR